MGRTPKLDSHLVAQRRQDVAELVEAGETFENVAKRLGLTKVALDQWLQRHAKDLRARLNAERGGRVRTASIKR